jgi:hypothetical protein
MKHIHSFDAPEIDYFPIGILKNKSLCALPLEFEHPLGDE